MKKIFAVLIVLFTHVNLFSQSTNPTDPSFISIQAGTTFPAAPTTFNTYYSLGFYGAAAFDKSLSNLVSVGLDANYSMYTIDGNNNTVTGEMLSLISLTPYVRIGDNVGIRSVTPYGRIGVGYGFASATTAMKSTSIVYQKNAESGYAILLGGGIDIHLPDLNKITFEVSYRLNHVPGLDYGGALIGFGYHFRL
jgi:opacity protein-like surface antigen